MCTWHYFDCCCFKQYYLSPYSDFCPKHYLRACYAILQAFNGSFCFRLESLRKMVYNILVYRVLRLETLCTDGFCVPINTVVCISRSVFWICVYMTEIQVRMAQLVGVKDDAALLFCIFTGDFPLIIRDCFIRIFIESNA